MKDRLTDKKLIVEMDREDGPFVRVSNYGDADALEDILGDEYGVIFTMSNPKELEEEGGKIYYFGSIADPVKLQAILDEIKLNED